MLYVIYICVCLFIYVYIYRSNLSINSCEKTMLVFVTVSPINTNVEVPTLYVDLHYFRYMSKSGKTG
jgi:hypothetical protein